MDDFYVKIGYLYWQASKDYNSNKANEQLA